MYDLQLSLFRLEYNTLEFFTGKRQTTWVFKNLHKELNVGLAKKHSNCIGVEMKTSTSHDTASDY